MKTLNTNELEEVSGGIIGLGVVFFPAATVIVKPKPSDEPVTREASEG